MFSGTCACIERQRSRCRYCRFKVRLHTAINRSDFVSWWMWFNGSHTEVQRHFLTDAFCYLLYVYNIHQDTKSARLIAVCKRSIKGWVSGSCIARVYYCFHTGSLEKWAIAIFRLVYLHFGKLQSNTFTERIPKVSTDSQGIDGLENELNYSRISRPIKLPAIRSERYLPVVWSVKILLFKILLRDLNDRGLSWKGN